MSVLFNGAVSGSSSVDTGDIGHSLRCRSAASAYLSRTPVTPVITDLWSMSFWIKRGQLGTKMLGGCGTVAGNSFAYCFDTTDHLQAYYPGTGAILNAVTNGVFRDHTAFIHVVMSCDLGNAVPADRFQFWVNGVRQTLSTYNFTAGLNFNNNQPQQICKHPVWSLPNDGYMSRICFVDQQQLTPSSFGYLNTEINEWVSKSQSAVKAVVDAGGTNSFMLDFDDATSLTTLGYDKSSKGNNWTLNNFSLTAGTTYDHMLDVPGNSYATLNPLQYNPASCVSGNLQFTTSATQCGRGVPDLRSCGKSYFEFPSVGTNYTGWGVQDERCTSTSTAGNNNEYLWAVYNTGTMWMKITGSSATNTGVAPPASGGTCCVAFDAATGKLWLGYAASGTSTPTWIGGGDPAAGTTPTATLGSTYAIFPHADYVTGAGSQTCTFNAGQYPSTANSAFRTDAGGFFHCVPPTGFKALCQANLPTPAILNPSSSVAHRFEAGSGIASAITTDRSGWSDWMEWFKRTDTTESWKVRFSDDSGNMMAFDTNGAKAAWSAPSTGTYLGAAFKLGASSGCVSGTYSGDSTSNKNISHSLGKVPTAALVKNESTGSWYVWHTKMTSAAYFTTLNSATPPAQSNTNTPWGTGNWSSTQFMVTNNATNNLNATGSTYRYILFADIDGLLALLGHTGNASTDGAFEYAGHKAQLLIEKDLSATTGFYVWSDKIDTYNVTASYLLLNTNAGTAAATGVDVCSNGTKYRSATIANATNPHMGISYSRTPGKYSLGR